MYIATLFVLILLYFAHFGSTEQTACPCENKSWCQPIEKVPEREVSECRGSTTSITGRTTVRGLIRGRMLISEFCTA